MAKPLVKRFKKNPKYLHQRSEGLTRRGAARQDRLMTGPRREPSCMHNHDAMRRELRDKDQPPTPCPECGWVLSPAKSADDDFPPHPGETMLAIFTGRLTTGIYEPAGMDRAEKPIDDAAE